MSTGNISAIELRNRIIEGGEFALLDVRESARFAAGHISVANNTPISRLELDIRRLVPCKSTCVVLTDNGSGSAGYGARVLEDLGYTKILVHGGGTVEWKQAGFELFKGTNVPSKAFGEIVEESCETPEIDAEELHRRRQSGENLIVLDSRPWNEYRAFNIPGSVNCPNSELAYRFPEIVKDGDTTVVVNCAGRTRSIIGAQTLRNLDVANQVYALRNGTIGWEWAGLSLEHGASRRFDINSGSGRFRQKCIDLAEANGVGSVDWPTLEQWQGDEASTTYLFDVRLPEECATGSVAGAVCVEGTQLIQETDRWIAVRDARIVITDQTGLRSRVVAHWLRQMGYPRVFVHDRSAFSHTPQSHEPEGIQAVSPEFAARENHAVIDVSSSTAFCKEHPRGARWVSRSRLNEILPEVGRMAPVVVLDDENGRLAALAVRDLQEAGIVACVLDGGLLAWKQAGLQTESGSAGAMHDIEDVAEVPFESTNDPELARRDYIDWELQLPTQVRRDGLVTFRPMASG